MFKLLSSTFEGTLPSSPLAVTALIGTLVVQSAGGGDPEPKTSSSVIDAQSFAVLPFTVTLTYLASVAGMKYFSEFSVVPLLVLVSLLVNVVPSVEVDITKLYARSFHLYHAMSTLQMFLVDPRSAAIN